MMPIIKEFDIFIDNIIKLSMYTYLYFKLLITFFYFMNGYLFK